MVGDIWWKAGSRRRLKKTGSIALNNSIVPVPEIEGSQGFHNEEVGWEAVLREVVVGQVEDLNDGEGAEPAGQVGQLVHPQVQDSTIKRGVKLFVNVISAWVHLLNRSRYLFRSKPAIRNRSIIYLEYTAFHINYSCLYAAFTIFFYSQVPVFNNCFYVANPYSIKGYT